MKVEKAIRAALAVGGRGAGGWGGTPIQRAAATHAAGLAECFALFRLWVIWCPWWTGVTSHGQSVVSVAAGGVAD